MELKKVKNIEKILFIMNGKSKSMVILKNISKNKIRIKTYKQNIKIAIFEKMKKTSFFFI